MSIQPLFYVVGGEPAAKGCSLHSAPLLLRRRRMFCQSRAASCTSAQVLLAPGKLETNFLACPPCTPPLQALRACMALCSVGEEVRLWKRGPGECSVGASTARLHAATAGTLVALLLPHSRPLLVLAALGPPSQPGPPLSLLLHSLPRSYDLSAMLFAPLFGVWTDRSGRYKAAIQVGAAVNAAGNLVYAFTVLADQWWIMAVARCRGAAWGVGAGVGAVVWGASAHCAGRARGKGCVAQRLLRRVSLLTCGCAPSDLNKTMSTSPAVQAGGRRGRRHPGNWLQLHHQNHDPRAPPGARWGQQGVGARPRCGTPAAVLSAARGALGGGGGSAARHGCTRRHRLRCRMVIIQLPSHATCLPALAACLQVVLGRYRITQTVARMVGGWVAGGWSGDCLECVLPLPRTLYCCFFPPAPPLVSVTCHRRAPCSASCSWACPRCTPAPPPP